MSVCLIVLNATFNNISVIPWRSVLSVEEIGEPFILAFDEYNISPFQCHNSVKLQLIYMSILYSMLEQPVEQFIVMYMLVRHYTVHRLYGNWIYNYLCNQCLSPLFMLLKKKTVTETKNHLKLCCTPDIK
jgi:hypothetical protein